ncbi:MAG: alanine racemase [Chloroflexi bacterium]|nr:alanine racemase [Chloroflexota bacterium]
MITLTDLQSATGAQLVGAPQQSSWCDFCHDSRLAQPGQLFVALRTPTGDGHDYIKQAVARGCSGVLCQHPVPEHPAVTTLLVSDTAAALRAWAAHILRQSHCLVIGISGSSGKTTAKELLAAMLAQRYPGQVFRTHLSYNDRLGIPLALGRLQPEHRFAVIEMGTDAHGEMAELAALTRPVVGALTVINDAHVGAFGSEEAIAAEKAALLQALPPQGLAVINGDDPYQAEMAATLPATALVHGSHAAAVQLAPHPDDARSCYLTVQPEALPVLDTRAWLERGEIRFRRPASPPAQPQRTELPNPLLGAHQIVTIRTAVTLALALAASPAHIRAALLGFTPLPGRMRPLVGIGGSTLIDDSYGANPAATQAALQVLATLSPPRIAVLGRHSGLGRLAQERLEALGPTLAASVDKLVLVGEQGSLLAGAAMRAGLTTEQIYRADTPAAAADLVRPLLRPGASCLIKGSREARMERVTQALLAEPGQADQVLPRQNPAWQHLRLRNTLRPTWLEIDTLAIADNVRAARARLQEGVQLIAVLKADAYGHGADTVARIVAQAGADMLAVACVSEAQTLRRAGIDLPILILGYTPPWQARTALQYDLQLTVYDGDVAQALSQAAADLNRSAQVHVKVDSGMGRLGLYPQEIPPFLAYLHTLPHLAVVGLFTHMAIADEPEHPFTDAQLGRFKTLLQLLEAQGLRPHLVHAANTATLLSHPDAHFDAVRLGIGLYGLSPAPNFPFPSDFRPALTWKTTIAQVKTLPPGAPIGYGLSYRTEGMQTIAVIPVGYADGFRRAPRNWGHVLVRGQRAPLVGRVSMDQSTIDVSHIPGVRPGDEVVLIGRQSSELITADEVAERLGTINYEVISVILARVPRLPE